MAEVKFEAGQAWAFEMDNGTPVVRILGWKVGKDVWRAAGDGHHEMTEAFLLERGHLVAAAPQPGQRWSSAKGRVRIIENFGAICAMDARAVIVHRGGEVSTARWLLDGGYQLVADAPAAAPSSAAVSVAPPTLPAGNEAPAFVPPPAFSHGARVRCPSGDVWTVAVRGDQARLERGALAMPWVTRSELARYIAENRFEPLPSWEESRRWIDEAIATERAAHPELFARALRRLGEPGQDIEPPTQRLIQATIEALHAAEARAPERDAILHARDAFTEAMGGDHLWWIAGTAVDLYLAARAAC